MEQTLLGKILFGKDANELVGQYNELISGLAFLQLRCPKTFWALESAILDSQHYREYYVKQIPLAKEEWKKDKEEIVYLKGQVINLEEEIIKLREDVAKLKAAKRKKSRAKK